VWPLAGNDAIDFERWFGKAQVLLVVLLVLFLPAFLPSSEVIVGCAPKSVRHTNLAGGLPKRPASRNLPELFPFVRDPW
jgi:hypothetical protein